MTERCGFGDTGVTAVLQTYDAGRLRITTLPLRGTMI